MGLEALLGDGVVRLELHPHVVVLGGDDLRLLGTTELAVQLGVGCESAAHLHEVVLAHLQGSTAPGPPPPGGLSWPPPLSRLPVPWVLSP